MRIDGVMRNMMTVPKELQASVLSRLKVMGGMDIAERRVPQDGRANVQVKQKDIDLRMSTLPTIYGEKLVIRVLDKDGTLFNKKALGLSGEELEKYDRLLSMGSGVVLIVGPTGSGKSSTMYAMLRELNTPEVNIITLEDPVEYQLEGINQVQINEKTGMVFSSGLRAILRQDPDIIGVGEIRDGETATIAMRAAITGHLVISTIHTSSAAAAIDRLLDIGVEPYLIAGRGAGRDLPAAGPQDLSPLSGELYGGRRGKSPSGAGREKGIYLLSRKRLSGMLPYRLPRQDRRIRDDAL